MVERHDPLGDPAGRSDDDRHHGPRIEEQDFDVPHRRGLERRGGNKGELTSYTREHLRRRLEGRVDLTAQLGEVEWERSRTLILAREQLIGVEPIALFGRNPSGRRVRVCEQASRLQFRELVSHGRRRDLQPAALDEVSRPDRLAGGDVLLDHERQQVALSCRQGRRRIRGHLQEF